MNRLQQLLKEALDEIEIYGSWVSLYYILKLLAESNVEKLCKEQEVAYHMTVDSLTLFTIYKYGGGIDKTRLFVLSFLLYDYLSRYYNIQNPIFSIKWNKRYFVYSPRIDSRLHTLSKKSLILKKERLYYLNQLGRSEAESINIREKDNAKVDSIVTNLKSLKKVKDIRIFVRRHLLGNDK
ncbi:hypothetical protein SULI_02845 [Saccharolobus solfataricus]|uniref:Uncharacterized protein n=3 Tax=Saccharolobus solfataricus TaxID=2287 RepID=Q97V82_SACS2|nr:hypothetical protein [Saccharolobus solfataricus]AAK42863.1 Hypothetical protein SSO2753 [Saccharolobus solfataricus P2]AKA72954.1 hypothetical protein SULB_0557 [Saccharolobus solfataricus]AKA75653.1 hypothetical protein SULC_0555 [Saccharolobus solfataricus]AKA78346.1 hypothetical protein SULA_0555 [Saccharolobus solfataricus]AZF67465.1 hypothetical protein SULG_02845 [Saccharolobus solfataricus]